MSLVLEKKVLKKGRLDMKEQLIKKRMKEFSIKKIKVENSTQTENFSTHSIKLLEKERANIIFDMCQGGGFGSIGFGKFPD